MNKKLFFLITYFFSLMPDCFSYGLCEYADNIEVYNTIDYSFNYGDDCEIYHRNKHGSRYNRFNSFAFLRRWYGGANYFSAGISSYQGTSTGPGPNGGYPGSPRGFYKTNYIGN